MNTLNTINTINTANTASSRIRSKIQIYNVIASSRIGTIYCGKLVVSEFNIGLSEHKFFPVSALYGGSILPSTVIGGKIDRVAKYKGLRLTRVA